MGLSSSSIFNMKTAGRLANTTRGKQFVGALAQPVFRSMESIQTEKIQAQIKGRAGEVEKSAVKNIFAAIANNFAWGDVVSIAGLFSWAGIQKYFPKDDDEPGSLFSFRGIFLNAARLVTFGGIGLHVVGKMFDLDREFGLGDKYAQALLDDAESIGKGIFKKYTSTDSDGFSSLDEFKDKALELSHKLVYDKKTRAQIMKRHESDNIGGFFEGPFGTGKTAGVEYILGRWAAKLEARGEDATIAKLSIKNYNDYISQRMKAKRDAKAVAGAVDSSLETFGSDNDGLVVLELLVNRIQKINEEVDAHNANLTLGGKKKHVAIFIDEYDKVFDPSMLAGCDKSRLRAVMTEFNELYVKGNVLLTSNKRLETIIKVLQDQLGETDQENETSGAMLSRMSKNRIRVELPAPPEQARIITNNLIQEYSGLIDLKSFNLPADLDLTNEAGKRELAGVIWVNISDQEGSNALSGRHAEEAATEKILAELSDAADEIRGANPVFEKIGGEVPDQQWLAMTVKEKAEMSGARISQAMLLNVAQLQQESERPKTKANLDTDLSFEILEQYLNDADNLATITNHYKDADSNAASRIFDVLGDIYDKRSKVVKSRGTERVTYSSKKPTEVEGVFYMHDVVIEKSKAVDGTELGEQVKVNFYEHMPQGGKPDYDDVEHSAQVTRRQFEMTAFGKIAHALQSKFDLSKLFGKLFENFDMEDASNALSTLLKVAAAAS